MGDSEFSEPMDELHDYGADKIDMSLDEIIKLNKKEQKADRAKNRAKRMRVTNRNNVLKKLYQTPQPQRGLRQGLLQYQGPIRSRGLTRSRGLERQSGHSPFNRANTMTGEQPVLGRGRGRGRGGLSRGALSARVQRVPGRGGRPFVLDRGFPPTRETGKLERYHKIRSQRTTSTSRTTLTVSLPNAKSSPVNQVRTQQGGTVMRGRSSEVVNSRPPPKGIPLHFNYKAATNQTQLSLNERFTSLRLSVRGLRLKKESGRGQVRGRGRGVINEGPAMARGGKGRGRVRGSCRTVFLQ